MYLIQCANAYLAAVQLGQKELDYQTALALVLLKKQLQSHVEFMDGEEMKLAEKYALKDEKGRIAWTERGTFQFPDEEAAEAYRKARTALGQTEVTAALEPLRAKAPERITAAQLEALEGFLVFEQEEA